MRSDSIIDRLGAVVLDVRELGKMADFWGAVLGEKPGDPRSGGSWLTVGALTDDTWLVLKQVPETKIVKNRLHLDFKVDNVGAAAERITKLGGAILNSDPFGRAIVMADPEGNEFCIGDFVRDREGRRIYQPDVIGGYPGSVTIEPQ